MNRGDDSPGTDSGRQATSCEQHSSDFASRSVLTHGAYDRRFHPRTTNQFALLQSDRLVKYRVLMYSDLRENNTIFLMHLVSDAYVRAHNLSRAQFIEQDGKYRIVRFISRCPDVFDNMTEDEMVKEVDAYVSCSR